MQPLHDITVDHAQQPGYTSRRLQGRTVWSDWFDRRAPHFRRSKSPSTPLVPFDNHASVAMTNLSGTVTSGTTGTRWFAAASGRRSGRRSRTPVDIDKMHAYRDAIRGPEGERLVRYAATLYPGPTVTYTRGLEAIRAYPGEDGHLAPRVSRILEPC